MESSLLMRRSLKYVCDKHGLDTKRVKSLHLKAKESLKELVDSVYDDMEFNMLKYFRPFSHQKRFFHETCHADRRGLLAANRVGKTVATCYETTLHLTGLYPDWWEGKTYDSPVTVFVAGEGWQQTAMVLQNELMGTSDVKLKNRLGTGTIPKDNIVFSSIRSDGANVLSCEIKHKSGQLSRLIFGNYSQDVRLMQGFKLNIAVFDEQPPDDFFSEIVTRTATTQGQILCSFTPLKGINGLVSKFWNLEEGYSHIRVSWDDVPEYDPWGEPFLLKTTRLQLERDYLPHERDARRNGTPVMGKGAVFPISVWPTYKNGDYSFTGGNIERIIALDLGLINDKTVITMLYYDEINQEMWLNTQIVVKGTEEANPSNYINHLLRPEVKGTPIVLPADASSQGRYTMSSLSIRQLFESYDLNVYKDAIMNPPDEQGRRTNHKSFGINTMRQMMEAGTFHINENCTDFLREAQNYYVDETGRFSDPDDCIDSARYAVLGCLNGIAERFDSRGPNQRFRDAKNNARLIANRNDTKPVWKQTFDPTA